MASNRSWPRRPALWRWHFYAGLFCVPFVLWLSITGGIYLFRPQVEAWLDAPYRGLARTGPAAAPSAQVAAAVAAVPGAVFHRYQLPEAPGDAAQVIVGRGRAETRVYVHPQSLAILARVDEDSRPMRIVFRLHGELLAGDTGSYLVELAASWAIIMLVSGLLLWWPHGGGLAGVVYPRLGRGRRALWRDLHAVTGFWVSAMALFLLLSGLPWAKSWGGYLKAVRSVTEGQVKQDWSSGQAAMLAERAAFDAGTRAMMNDHAEHQGMTMAHPPGDEHPLDRLVPVVAQQRLAPPVLIAPPTAPGQPWTAKSDAANRPLRSDLTLTADGRILGRRDFAGRKLIDRLVGWGVAIHEGQAFGWANQLLNLLTALGLMLLSVSSVVLWLRRRPAGRLGAPPPRPRPGFARGFGVLLVLLGVLLPLFGLSLLAVLLVERLVLRRWPAARIWLGLPPPGIVSPA
ncbi:MAG: peptidase [Proteobacteria bacterium SG_bin6]|nr:MAG: peptidase [Proteobacteria bacterium SG_bin6]